MIVQNEEMKQKKNVQKNKAKRVLSEEKEYVKIN